MKRTEQLDYLIQSLSPSEILPKSEDEKWLLYRSFQNVRKPKPVSADFLAVQDEMLKSIIAEKGITDITDLTPISENIYLWQGDITTLKVDCIVNAANSGMLGCFCPCHACIDNAIHTFAGVRLRLECAEIIQKQGFNEPTGKAKITKGYNLPSKYVLHTVGPIIKSKLTEQECKLLADCYHSCLELAVLQNLQSIAFCCISTGEFCFPNKEAAEIAFDTVLEFQKTANIKVIFNVFKDIDYKIYKKSLQ